MKSDNSLRVPKPNFNILPKGQDQIAPLYFLMEIYDNDKLIEGDYNA